MSTTPRKAPNAWRLDLNIVLPGSALALLLLATVTSTAAALDPCPPRSSTCLNYSGGPVIENATFVQVLYGSGTYQSFVNTTGASTVSGFLMGIGGSAYFQWLTEYNTTTQKIGNGAVCQLSLDHAFPVERRCDHHRRVNSGRDLGADQLRAFAGAQQQPDLHNIFSKRQNNQPRQFY